MRIHCDRIVCVLTLCWEAQLKITCPTMYLWVADLVLEWNKNSLVSESIGFSASGGKFGISCVRYLHRQPSNLQTIFLSWDFLSDWIHVHNRCTFFFCKHNSIKNLVLSMIYHSHHQLRVVYPKLLLQRLFVTINDQLKCLR